MWAKQTYHRQPNKMCIQKKKDHKLLKIKMKENQQKYCTVMMAGTQKITAQTVKDKLNNYVKGR